MVFKMHFHFKNLHIIHLKANFLKMNTTSEIQDFFFFLVKNMDHVTNYHFYTYIAIVGNTSLAVATFNVHKKKQNFE